MRTSQMAHQNITRNTKKPSFQTVVGWHDLVYPWPGAWWRQFERSLPPPSSTGVRAKRGFCELHLFKARERTSHRRPTGLRSHQAFSISWSYHLFSNSNPTQDIGFTNLKTAQLKHKDSIRKNGRYPWNYIYIHTPITTGDAVVTVNSICIYGLQATLSYFIKSRCIHETLWSTQTLLMNCNLKDTVGWQVDIGTVISTRAIFIAELSTGKAMGNWRPAFSGRSLGRRRKFVREASWYPCHAFISLKLGSDVDTLNGLLLGILS